MTIDSLTIERALQTINNLQHNLEQARKENRMLRSRTEAGHPYHINTSGRILRRAFDDAHAVIMLKVDGYPVGRGFCYGLGYSERRYFWAMGLLRSARVVSARGSQWIVDDFVTADKRVDANYERLKSQPNALEMLRMYMPRKMQYAYRGKG